MLIWKSKYDRLEAAFDSLSIAYGDKSRLFLEQHDKVRSRDVVIGTLRADIESLKDANDSLRLAHAVRLEAYESEITRLKGKADVGLVYHTFAGKVKEFLGHAETLKHQCDELDSGLVYDQILQRFVLA